MLSTAKLLHILILAFVSILYTGCIVQLVLSCSTQLYPSDWILAFLASYFIIFFFYTIKTYAMFHYPPTQPSAS
jgi:hypothetical protein